MKKLLVMAAALTLVSTSAFAFTVVGTKHDLKASGAGSTEVCAYCHTPHNATAPAASALTPLMTRGTGTASTVCFACHDGSGIQVAGLGTAVTVGAAANFGTLAVYDAGVALGTDHPVGVAFVVDSNFLSAGTVECSSCHNVHDNTNGDFLRMSNAASALCVTCHAK